MRIAIVCSAALFVAACSPSAPVGEARQAFEVRLKNAFPSGEYRIDSFEKTNGQASEVNGVPGYRILYRATVTFPEGYLPECVDEFGNLVGARCSIAGGQMGRPQPRGARVEYRGEMRFEKMDRGWNMTGFMGEQVSMTAPPPPPTPTPTPAPPPAPPAPGAATAGDTAYARGEVARQIGACRVLTTRAKLAAVSGDPDKNVLTLTRAGALRWNSLAVDDGTLSQYLENASAMPEVPWVIFEPEAGVDPERLYAVQKIIVASGICGG